MTTPNPPAPNTAAPVALIEELTPSTDPHALNHEDVTREVNKRTQVRLDGIPRAVVEFSGTLPTPEELGAAPATLTGRVEALEAQAGTVGLRMVRGRVSVANGSTTAIAFATPFAAPPFVATNIDSGSTVDRYAAARNITVNGFDLVFVRDDTTATGVDWAAFGV